MVILPRNIRKIVWSFVTTCILILPLSTGLQAGLWEWLSGKPRPKPAPKIEKPEGPSRDDLIKAVQDRLAGKKYKTSVTRVEPQWVTCSQIDVQMARCAQVGFKRTIPVTVTKTEMRDCKRPPDTGWSVQKIGSDRWRVSNSGSTWDLTRMSGGGVNPDTVYIPVKGSSWAFKIEAHQDC